MLIRAYTSDDLPVVVDIWSRASLIAHAFLPAAFFDEERIRIADVWLPMSETTVCEHDGRVVGFLSLVGDEIGGLFVDPDAQGKGYGRALVDDARTRRAVLELSVFEANDRARGFYSGCGFVVVGRDVDEDTGQPALRLRLSAGDDDHDDDHDDDDHDDHDHDDQDHDDD